MITPLIALAVAVVAFITYIVVAGHFAEKSIDETVQENSKFKI